MAKSDAFEESTKIHSSSELDEILRQARTRPVMQDDDDIEGSFEEHTRIGPVAELVAQSMTIEDQTPPPIAAPRTSTKNVVRRTAPVPVVQPPEMMPVRAAGSLSEMTPPAPTDEDAFEPWDAMDAAPLEVAPVIAPPVFEAPVVEDVAPPTMIDAPRPMAMPMPAVIAKPVEVPAPKKLRWGAVAWVVLLVVMMGAGTMAYMRITALEEELAMTKSALEAAKGPR